MADERVDSRDVDLRRLWAWTELFRGFQVALDPKKLLLAAGGIVVMAFWWWFLAVIFYSSRPEPEWGSRKYEKWGDFQRDREKWNLLHEAAGDTVRYTDANDLAKSSEEWSLILDPIDKAIKSIDPRKESARVVTVVVGKEKAKDKDGKEVERAVTREYTVSAKPHGRLRGWPWFEDRGPNPYLMAVGRTGKVEADGTPRYVPWDRGQFFEWFSTKQLFVLVEPLIKFFRPVTYLLRPEAGFLNYLYFLLVALATLATWALFGGAITRMAAVQLARKEKIGMGEALRFAVAQWKSYLSASVLPLLGVAVLVFLLALFGVPNLLAGFGDIWSGLLWPLVLIAGVLLAILLVGYAVGWPLIHATISTEGSDAFDALSRTYSYVFQRPWAYLWYAGVALVYGAVVVFFVGFMGSLTVYLGKWGVSQTPFSGPNYTNREPSYLFVWAPESFGWRPLLLQGATTDSGQAVVEDGVINETARAEYINSFRWYNYLGVFLVSVWIYLIFLMIVGFGYSYFWSASTIIYLLMRRSVDDTEMDEVYLEEEETEDAYTTPTVPEPAKPATTSLPLVETPALRTPAGPAPAGGNGNPAPSGGANP